MSVALLFALMMFGLQSIKTCCVGAVKGILATLHLGSFVINDLFKLKLHSPFSMCFY